MMTTTEQRSHGIRQNGQWVLTLNQLTVAAVVVVVAILLLVAALMAGPAQTAAPLGSAPGDTTSAHELGEKYSNSTATKQVLAGFGLFSFWVIAGAFSIARSRGSKEFRFGTPRETIPS
ncbi:MAG: hypothetical protein R2733_19475 [Acidimicrobiales bacterium]